MSLLGRKGKVLTVNQSHDVAMSKEMMLSHGHKIEVLTTYLGHDAMIDIKITVSPVCRVK